MKIIPFFYLTFFALLFFSCTKFGKTITIKGKVLNPVTQQGLGNAKLRLLKLTPNGFQEKEKEVKSVTTDNNGYFEIDQLGLTKDFVLSADDVKGNYRLGWYRNGSLVSRDKTLEVKKGKKTTVEYHILSFGKLREEIHNIIDPHPNDLMQYRRRAWFDNDFGAWSSYKVGLYDNNGSDLEILPIGKWYYETKLTRNAEDIYFYDSVFVSDFGVATVLINY